MPKPKVQKSDLMKLYYVQEKTVSDIAEHFGLGSEESIRYYLRKKDDNGKEIYKSRDRDIRQTDQHNMIQVFGDHAQGESFDHDMASVALLTQFRVSNVSEILKPYWEKKYGKAYTREDVDMTKEKSSEKTEEPVVVKKMDARKETAVDGKIILTNMESVAPDNLVGAISLRSVANVMLRPGDSQPVSVGIRLQVPEGHVGMVVPNPQLVRNKSITIVGAPQLVLPDDSEELIVDVFHFGKGSSTTTQQISVGEEIAKLVVVSCPEVRWEILD